MKLTINNTDTVKFNKMLYQLGKSKEFFELDYKVEIHEKHVDIISKKEEDITNIKNILKMKKLLSLLLFLFSFTCFSQTKKDIVDATIYAIEHKTNYDSVINMMLKEKNYTNNRINNKYWKQLSIVSNDKDIRQALKLLLEGYCFVNSIRYDEKHKVYLIKYLVIPAL